jgi:hypothetical protein
MSWRGFWVLGFSVGRKRRNFECWILNFELEGGEGIEL